MANWSNRSRFDGLSSIVMICFTVFLSVASISVVAQTAFEFEDPLEEMRQKIERGDPSQVTSPASVATPPETNTASSQYTPSADVKGPITVFAERLGLPTAGVVGLGALGLFGALLGLMWLIARRKAVRHSKRKNSEIYAVSPGARGRRTLESGAYATRNRKAVLDTSEQPEGPAKLTSAQKAALILSDEEANFDEFMLEEEAQSRGAAKAAVAAAATGVGATAMAAANDETHPDDPDTWKRPNLERLKASIRDDWDGKEEPVDPETQKLRSEAKVFADLFGDDTPPEAPEPKQKSPVLDMLNTYEDEGEAMPLSSLQSVVAKTAPTAAPVAEEATRTTDESGRSDALRRIKALRESVKAS